MIRCADIEAELVPHIHGELDVLRHARVDAHLLHCPRCAGATEALGVALEAGRAWVPELSDDELERLSTSLAGLRPVARARPLRALGVGLAVAASALLAVYATYDRGPDVVALSSAATPGHEVVVVPVSRAMDVAVTSDEAPVERARWTSEVRAVSSADWDGSVVHSPAAIDVYARRGFAVIALGDGARALRVRTDDVEVEVARSARLFVEIAAGRPTTVGVIAGRVVVVSGGEGRVLEAGQAAYGPAGMAIGAARSRAYHGDPFLSAGQRRAASSPPSQLRAAPRRRAIASHDLSALVAEAEDLARGGQVAAAELRLGQGLRTLTDGRARALLRFEIARLVARDPERRSEAIELLEALASEDRGEPSVQAAILRCQLDLDHDRCAARRCLEAVEPRAPEARRVLERSRLVQEPCGS